MGKVVGEAFLDIVMLLQSLERVLENRVFRNFLERLRELAQVGSALVPDAR